MSRRESDPLIPFGELRREMDRLFDGLVGGVNRGLHFRGHGDPSVNIWEDNESVCVEAEVPGISMNDLDVQVIHGELTIKGHRQASAPEGVTMHKQERLEGAFARSVSLPSEVNTDHVEAVLRDGVLVVTLPKSETVKPRKITVKGD